MDTNWSIECGIDDPVVVVPWHDPSGLRYVDLEGGLPAIDRIAEAQAWPEIRTALLALNTHASPVRTTKCDAWVLDEDEKQLDFGPVLYGFGAYVDVMGRNLGLFSSLAVLRARVERWAGIARTLAPDDARADFIIRPAERDGEAGHAVTIYVFGYGSSEADARRTWREVLTAIAGLIANATINERASSSTG